LGTRPRLCRRYIVDSAKPKPDDIILVTGESHSAGEFIELTFAVVGRKIRWRGSGIDEQVIDSKTGDALIKIDAKYYRPTEIHNLCEDYSNAKRELNWSQKTSFQEMVQYDLMEVRSRNKQ